MRPRPRVVRSQTLVLRPQFNRSVQVSITCKENYFIFIPRCQSEVASGKIAARNIFIFNLQGQCHEISDPRGPVCSPIWASYSIFICWRMFAYGLDFVEIFTSAKTPGCHWHCGVKLSSVIGNAKSDSTVVQWIRGACQIFLFL